MRHAKAFTLPESAAAVLVLAVLLCLLLPACRESTRKRSMAGYTLARGIHSGMVLYSQGNKDYFPGLDADGQRSTTPIPAGPGTYGTDSTDGYDPSYRMALLLRSNMFSPEYILSYAESNRSKRPVQLGEDLSPDNFSCALLRIDQEGTGRRREWRNTENALAPIASDRNLESASKPLSIHNFDSPGKGWTGSVVYNDNHAQFEMSHIVKTEYATNQTAADNLFADDNDDKGKPGNDAAMVYQNATTYADQR